MSEATLVPEARNGLAGGRREAASEEGSTARLALELLLFAFLGAFALAQWSRLIEDPPLGRLAICIAILCATGGALRLGAARIGRRWLRRAVAAATVLVAGALAALAVGLPADLVVPSGWGELADLLDRGLAGIEDTRLPYDGADEAIRLTLLAIAASLLTVGTALSFWPARHARVTRALRLAGLAFVVAVYGVAVTLDAPSAELVWGVPLFLGIVAWLWLPGAGRGGRALAVAIVSAAGAIAVPVAAALDRSGPAWDYESWDWFGRDSEVSFNWDHSYGPLEWPREGTTVLEVTSAEPLYWKASVLDRFDGFTWQRALAGDPLAALERGARRQALGDGLAERHPEWRSQATFELAALSGEAVVGAGTIEASQGLADAAFSADGTVSMPAEPLANGDRYSIVTYYPQPTADQLRRASERYPARFGGATLIGLPARVTPLPPVGPAGSTAGAGAAAGNEALGDGLAPSRAISMPLWGRRDSAAEAQVLASPYGGMYELARELTASAPTPYAATLAIQRHLQGGYDYTPNVPQHTYPLAAFIGDDEAGYCQQFAGSMALMLRMMGIPARVVSGFAPGTLNSEEGVYEVRDLDAHAWVEVFFRGIGWVTFDPTPAAAPAASQALGGGSQTFFRGRGSVADEGQGRAESLERAIEGGVVPGREESGSSGVAVAVVLAILLMATLVASLEVSRRRRALERGELAGAQVTELRAALERLGWRVSPAETLLGLERRFASAGRRSIASYAAALRAHRYAPAGARPPGPSARTALRRSLARGGVRRRWRALRALPPGGPARGSRR